MEYLGTQLESAVHPQEVWIPIANLFIEHDFVLGKVEIRTITKTDWDRWRASSIECHPEHAATRTVIREGAQGVAGSSGSGHEGQCRALTSN